MGEGKRGGWRKDAPDEVLGLVALARHQQVLDLVHLFLHRLCEVKSRVRSEQHRKGCGARETNTRTALPDVCAISVSVLNTVAMVSRAGRNMVRWLLRLLCIHGGHANWRVHECRRRKTDDGGRWGRGVGWGAAVRARRTYLSHRAEVADGFVLGLDVRGRAPGRGGDRLDQERLTNAELQAFVRRAQLRWESARAGSVSSPKVQRSTFQPCVRQLEPASYAVGAQVDRVAEVIRRPRDDAAEQVGQNVGDLEPANGPQPKTTAVR